MTESTPLKLAVVAEDSLQQHRLRSAMEDFGCEVVCLSPQSLHENGMDQQVSAWLVDLREDDSLLDSFFEIDEPVLLGFESAPSKQAAEYPKWEKRLYGKLKQLLGLDIIQANNTQASLNLIDQFPPVSKVQPLPDNVQSEAGSKAKYVFTLGSSLGGPEAIKEFLDALPKGLPVGFVYGQHIDAQFVSVLAQVLARHAQFKLSVAEHGMELRSGEVLIVPADKEVHFEQGFVTVSENSWPGPYGPSVDQLILNVQKGFPTSGIILFSGMGNDGAEAIQALKQIPENSELQIWAQSAKTCASSAMPDACRKTGAVNFSASPQELAKHLVEYIESQETNIQQSICKNESN